MKNRSGQFFALYLVVLTIMMCGMAIMIYYLQERNTTNSIVSPVKILEISDKQEKFQMQEKLIISSVIKELVDVKWGSGEFRTRFGDIFYSKLNLGEQKDMRVFLFSDTSVEGINRAFFDTLYTIEFRGNDLVVSRSNIERSFFMGAPERSKINFVAVVRHSYDKTWNCDSLGKCR